MNNNSKLDNKQMALEEWKALSDMISRLENTEYTMRNWLLGIVSSLVVALNFAKNPIPWYTALIIGIGIITLFVLMDLVHRMPKRYAIERAKRIEESLKGNIEYDGPCLTSPVSPRNRPGKFDEFLRMWDNTPYRHIFLLLTLFLAVSTLTKDAPIIEVVKLIISAVFIYFIIKIFNRYVSRYRARKRGTIDITSFDESNLPQVKYFFNKNDFSNPIRTLRRFASDREKFKKRSRDHTIILTSKQEERLIHYLKNETFHVNNFGSIEDATHLLAFSFGESPDVNMELALLVQHSMEKNSGIRVAVQWEISDIISERDVETNVRIERIELGEGKEYINTKEIIEKFCQRFISNSKDDVKLAIVAQSWHAPRCIKICEKEHGLNVIAGRFANRFPMDDPQEWTRNAFSWVLKEGTKV